MSEPMIGALKIDRVAAGESMIVRMLSTDYGGLFTHWVRGRSQYCGGKECNPINHKLGRVWKGYCAAEKYCKVTKKWLPICLEITEGLELDFRTIYTRGQLWEIWRDMPTEKKQPPTQGKLLEDRGIDSCPPAFDYRPCLMHLYHIEYVDLTSPNPLPPRIILGASEGDAPRILLNGDAKPILTYEERKALEAKLNARKQSPSEKKAAKAPVGT